MKLLVTGALRITPEESAELENLGYEIYFMPDERVAVPENIPCEEIEAIYHLQRAVSLYSAG